MRQGICELCTSNNLVKTSDGAVCKDCGAKYSFAEMQELWGETGEAAESFESPEAVALECIKARKSDNDAVRAIKDRAGIGFTEARILYEKVKASPQSYTSFTATQSRPAPAPSYTAPAPTYTAPEKPHVVPSTPAPEAVVKRNYDVVIEYIGASKLNVIATIRSITGFGLKEAKDLVESAPATVVRNISEPDAKTVMRQLTKAGATASMRESSIRVVASSAASAAAESTEFDIILVNSGNNKLPVVKAIKEITGLGLKEAKDIVDSTPRTVKEGVSKEEAQKIAKQLRAVGATVEIK